MDINEISPDPAADGERQPGHYERILSGSAWIPALIETLAEPEQQASEFLADPDEEAQVDLAGEWLPACAPVQSAPAALVPDLGLPAAPCSAVNADDVEPEDLGFVDNRDRPLTWHWRTDERVLAAAGLLQTGDPAYNRLLNSVATELVRAADIDPNVWVSISRNENKYTAMRRGKAPVWVGFNRMMQVLGHLHGARLVEEDKAKQGKDHEVWWQTPQGKWVKGRQSRYRATPRLVEAFRSVTSFHRDAGEAVIRMKDCNGNAVDDFRETDYVRKLAAPARAYNGFMRCQKVELVTQDAECNRTRITIRTPREDGTTAVQVLCPTPTVEVFRSFNRGKFTKGGRFYHPLQGLPSKLRRQLVINGSAVVELDYKALHPSMCYALRGLPVPADVYTMVPGVDEKSAKAAMVVMIGCKSRREAVEALLKKATDTKRPWRHDRARTKAILKAIEAAHAAIAQDFYRDKAVDLMFLDSQMTAYVLTQAVKRGLVCLPVHDSYVCPEADEATMRELMTAAWDKKFAVDCPRIEGGNLGGKIARESLVISRGSKENPLQTLSLPSPSASPGPCPSQVSLAPVVADFLDGFSSTSSVESSGMVMETVPVPGRAMAGVSRPEASGDLSSASGVASASPRKAPGTLANLKVRRGGRREDSRPGVYPEPATPPSAPVQAVAASSEVDNDYIPEACDYDDTPHGIVIVDPRLAEQMRLAREFNAAGRTTVHRKWPKVPKWLRTLKHL